MRFCANHPTTGTAMLLGLLCAAACWNGLPAADALVTVSDDSPRSLTRARTVGANVDAPFLADHLRLADAGWFDHTIRGTGMRFLRWGGIHWHALDDRPINSWQWFGFQTPDDEGSYGLDEFLALCKAEAITPIIICPFEPVPEDESTATTRADLIRLTGEIATFVAGLELPTEVYFEIGNEPWFDYTPEYYAGYLDDYYNVVKTVDDSFKVCIPLPEGDYKGYKSGLLGVDGLTDWFDASDTHDYPIFGSRWDAYYAKDRDNLGARGTRISGKETILGETYVIFGGWNSPDNFTPAHGSNLVQLNAWLDAINSNSIDHISFWPSVFADSSLANHQSDEGVFQYGTWTTDLRPVRNSGLSTITALINRTVDERWLRNSSCSDVKLRQFVYSDEALSVLKIVLINKDPAAKQVDLALPRSYDRLAAWSFTGADLDDRYSDYVDLVAAGSVLASDTATLTVPGHSAVLAHCYDDQATEVPGSFTAIAPVAADPRVSTQQCFAWTAAPGAGHYRLQVSTAADLSTPLIDIAIRGVTRWQDSRVLAPGTRYHWLVTAVNAAGSQPMEGGPATFVSAPELGYRIISDQANPGLEQDPLAGNDWQLQVDQGGATATWDATVSHDGSHSLRFDAASDDPSDIALVKQAPTQRLPVRPDHLYRIEAWFRGDGVWDPLAPVEELARAGNVYVWFYDDSGTTIGHRRMSGFPSWAGDNWEQRLYTTAAPAEAASMGIELRLTGVGTLWVDDLEVREYDPLDSVAVPDGPAMRAISLTTSAPDWKWTPDPPGILVGEETWTGLDPANDHLFVASPTGGG